MGCVALNHRVCGIEPLVRRIVPIEWLSTNACVALNHWVFGIEPAIVLHESMVGILELNGLEAEFQRLCGRDHRFSGRDHWFCGRDHWFCVRDHSFCVMYYILFSCTKYS